MAKKKKKTATGTHALEVLEKAGVDYELIEYEHSREYDSGYALDTAHVLGRDAATIFKTLITEADGKPVCAVVPATGMLNLKQLAKAVGAKKAKMMDPHAAENLTGYITGGISPLGQRTTLPTVIDESARNFPRIAVSGGKRTLSVDISADDLATLTHAFFAPIADSRHF